MEGKRSVAIIVSTANQNRFLSNALQSCIRQTVRPAEIVLVSGMADDETDRIAGTFPGVAVYRPQNTDRSDSESGALEKISSEFVIFLDAADRLTPSAVEAGLTCFDANPDAS